MTRIELVAWLVGMACWLLGELGAYIIRRSSIRLPWDPVRYVVSFTMMGWWLAAVIVGSA